MWDLVPGVGIEPVSVYWQVLNHRTTKDVPQADLFILCIEFSLFIGRKGYCKFKNVVEIAG